MIRRTTWILLGALGIAAVGYLARERLGPAPQAEATPAAVDTAWSLAAEDLRSLRLVDAHTGQAVALLRDPEVGWRLQSPAPGPADAARVEAAVASLLAPRIRQRLASPADLEAFGLAPASMSLTIFLADGSARSLEIGSVDPTGSVMYVQVPGANEVLMVSRYSLDAVLGLLTELPLQPTPTPTPVGTSTGTP